MRVQYKQKSRPEFNRSSHSGVIRRQYQRAKGESQRSRSDEARRESRSPGSEEIPAQDFYGPVESQGYYWIYHVSTGTWYYTDGNTDWTEYTG